MKHVATSFSRRHHCQLHSTGYRIFEYFKCDLWQPVHTTVAMASAKYCTVPEDTPAIEIRPDLSMNT
jgi:hypothetical protein